MGYSRDLDEYTEEELYAEIQRRELNKAKGLCCYCNREHGVEPSCKFEERHHFESDGKQLNILYTNYKNVTSWRCIKPLRMVHEKSQWHPVPQWILVAIDIEKGVIRNFAISDIKEWTKNYKN